MSPTGHVDGRTATRADRLTTDVVVIGSGPAGSTVARDLAAGGVDVLVLEAGPWVDPSAFALSAFRSMADTYRELGAAVAFGAAPTPLVQGRMVGGSSPINGAICWRLPRDVHDRWCADDPSLVDALPWEALEAATDRIEQRLNVSPTRPEVAGPKAQLMQQGADALGLAHRPIRRNVDGCVGLGRCMQGCPEGHKQSVDRTLLTDALRDGARLYSRTEATRIEVVGGRARRVLARTDGGARLSIEARHGVVLAASAVQSPALLLRSGLRHGPVGHGFQGHPGVAMAGRFPDPVRSWEGATQGHEVIGLRAEGLKFETLGYDLTVIASRMHGVGRAYAEAVDDMAHWVAWGAAIKSTARGRVRSILGRTVVTWSPTAQDLTLYRRGLRVMGEMMLAAGAERLSPGVAGFAPEVSDRASLARLEQAGPRPARAYRSVITHMFGTCRMGADPTRSVVRPDFRHHAIDRLWVADSSVFPSNTGVNPQISIMAMATLAARHVAAA